MNFSTWSIRHPVPPIAVFLVLLVVGLFTCFDGCCRGRRPCLPCLRLTRPPPPMPLRASLGAGTGARKSPPSAALRADSPAPDVKEVASEESSILPSPPPPPPRAAAPPKGFSPLRRSCDARAASEMLLGSEAKGDGE